MFARRFIAALAAAIFALLARAAAADVPSPTLSTIPTHIVLVGTDANIVPDPLGEFSITVRKLSGQPVRSSFVVVDLTGAPDLVVCSTQPQSGVTVQCIPGFGASLRAFTDNNGVVTFRIVGHANHAAPASLLASAAIYADGVPLGIVPVSAYDQDGNGLGGADQSLWLTDYFSGEYRERSDFDGDGALSGADLSLWRSAYFSDGSLFNCVAAACP